MAAAATRLLLAAIVTGLLGSSAFAQFENRPFPGTDCPVFPGNSWWHADVSKLPKRRRSDQWMARMSPERNLHPDFGPSYGAQPAPYGIPITVVPGSHPKVPVRFDYASESDRTRYPLGPYTKVEGGQWASGDRHTVVIDRDTCRLYETW